MNGLQELYMQLTMHQQEQADSYWITLVGLLVKAAIKLMDKRKNMVSRLEL